MTFIYGTSYSKMKLLKLFTMRKILFNDHKISYEVKQMKTFGKENDIVNHAQ